MVKLVRARRLKKGTEPTFSDKLGGWGVGDKS